MSSASPPPRRSLAEAANLWTAKFTALCDHHLNFYRVHVLAFVIIPLIFSGIFYASNGEHEIAYIDALFMCTSAMTVTGLQTILLGDLTTFQQVILFFLMCIGSTSGVSVLMILIRRHFFGKRFQNAVRTDPLARARIEALEERDPHPQLLAPPDSSEDGGPRRTPSPAGSALFRMVSGSRDEKDPEKARLKGEKRERDKEKERRKKHGISLDMVKRVNTPVRINAMNVGGFLDNDAATPHTPHDTGDIQLAVPQNSDAPPDFTVFPSEDADNDATAASSLKRQSKSSMSKRKRPLSDIQVSTAPLDTTTAISFAPDDTSVHDRRPSAFHSSPNPSHGEVPSSTGEAFPRSQTIGFTEPLAGRLARGSVDGHLFQSQPRTPSHLRVRKTRTMGSISLLSDNLDSTTIGGRGRVPLSSFTSNQPFQQRPPRSANSRQQDFGGFPNPVVVAGGLGIRLMKKVLPDSIGNEMKRSTTFPRTSTLQSTKAPSEIGDDVVERGSPRPGVKMVSYISFDAVVGRNSNFRHLTRAQKEELGGIEYRALNLLIKIVVGYWLFFQLFAVAIIAPYLVVKNKYDNVFRPADVGRTWFSFFQVSSAYTNCGMSLIDASMTVFQDATLMILVICVLILAGNTAFPVFLRLLIWTCSKCVPSKSRTRETFQFLLDHPRRCFIYLFPSYQTWFLVFALFVLNCTDWISFLVLDIGNPAIQDLPVPKRILAGLLQSFAVRAAGFQIVSLSSLAPAVNVLYAIMMYVAVYPIALTIRTSNVYEDKYLNHSMGIFADADSDDSSEEEQHAQSGNTGSYIAFHARKQLAFDLWWLVGAVWIICIVEKDQIEDPNKGWLNIFTILFELISAYGTVGLSQGLPYSSTSLSGSFRILSKLIVIVVMLRGRHRGLPIALDRAVLLPSDLVQHNDFPRTVTGSSNPRPRSRAPSQARPLSPTDKVDGRSTYKQVDVDDQPTTASTNVEKDVSNLGYARASWAQSKNVGNGSREDLKTSSPSSLDKSVVNEKSDANEISQLPVVNSNPGRGGESSNASSSSGRHRKDTDITPT